MSLANGDVVMHSSQQLSLQVRTLAANSRWALLAFPAAVALLVVYRFSPAPIVAFSTAIVCLVGGFQYATRLLLLRNRVLAAIASQAAGLWLLALAFCATAPDLWALAPTLILLPVILATAYVSQRQLVPFLTASVLAAVLCGVIVSRGPLLGTAPVTKGMLHAIGVGGVPVLVGVVGWALRYENSWLREALDRMQEANQRLHESERVLERQVAERTAELAQARDEALAANRQKSTFLANMSHELRTPLNSIIGFSEVLGTKLFGELNPKQAEYITDIHESGRHLLSLINDILDLSKIEAGRLELNTSSFELPAVVGNVLTLMKERAARRSVSLLSDVPARVGMITADERKVKQVLINLLSNAVKFTEAGGTVTIRIRLTPQDVVISVIDTGIGIAAADHQLIFEEFRQVTSDYTRKQEGTGLGLALCKRLVELHGGRIWVESQPGQGSVFTFTLPQQAAETRT
jgi:signal transduction histidine kinase